jgi:hypothetical protein
VNLFEAIVVIGLVASPLLLAWAGISPGLLVMWMALYGAFTRRALRRHIQPTLENAAAR